MLYDPRGAHYYGGRIAAPLFAAVMRKALRVLDVPPSTSLTPAQRGAPALPAGSLADFAENRPEKPADSAFGPANGRWMPVASRPESELASVTSPATARPLLVSQRASAFLRRPVPEMRGLTMREALAVASRLGIEIQAHGSGVVERQSPEPSTPLALDRIVNLYFGLSSAAQEDSEDVPGARGG